VGDVGGREERTGGVLLGHHCRRYRYSHMMGSWVLGVSGVVGEGWTQRSVGFCGEVTVMDRLFHARWRGVAC
jgi:hypothetical protein